MVERYDNLVIGGGMSGLPLALRAARHGRTAFVERELLGGTCLNRGCIPTKTMIASAQRAHDVRRAADLGVHTGEPTVDLAGIVDRKDDVVESIRSGSYRAVGKSGDLDFLTDHGRFVAERRLQVGERTIEADRIFLNTGTRDTIPAIDGLDHVGYLTSRTILDLREIPDHLVVVGGGFIGTEFAQMFARFGAKVTLVQRADRLLPAEDPDISAVVEEAFTGEGIDVLLGTACVSVAADGDRIRVGCEGAETDELVASHLLIATGRTANTDDLGIEHLDVTVDPRGYVGVDDRLHTDAEDVWALGDLRGYDMFTHTARDDADTVYRTVFKDQDRTIADRVVPHAVFLDPEVAAVGLTEQQARDAGYTVAVGRQEFSGVAKARAIGRTAGHITFAADAETDRILGCHIVGPDAGNLVHEAVIAMVAGVTYSAIGNAIHIHPTLAEGMNSAAGGVHRPSTDD
ncbi:MAG: mercuric reductase [Actinobacteria bacterium]|nr:mercuric reductase [Actinomycetota bacterium]